MNVLWCFFYYGCGIVFLNLGFLNFVSSFSPPFVFFLSSTFPFLPYDLFLLPISPLLYSSLPSFFLCLLSVPLFRLTSLSSSFLFFPFLISFYPPVFSLPSYLLLLLLLPFLSCLLFFLLLYPSPVFPFISHFFPPFLLSFLPSSSLSPFFFLFIPPVPNSDLNFLHFFLPPFPFSWSSFFLSPFFLAFLESLSGSFLSLRSVLAFLLPLECSFWGFGYMVSVFLLPVCFIGLDRLCQV